MNFLSTSKNQNTIVDCAPASLSERLVWLTRFGKPRVSYPGDGFYAVIEMHVSAVGITFKIDSDMRHPTPDAAVEQMIERMLSALADVKKATGG